MGLLLRIDVDRPYGKAGFLRHIASRVNSDFYSPRFRALGYFDEHRKIICILNDMKTPAYIFFRRCTLPSQLLQRFIMEGGHRVGLHLENSRTYGTFKQELFYLQKYINAPIEGFSNHGSGEHRYGRRYYAPYEPNKYISWENQQGLKYFFSNQQDPTLRPVRICSIICLPSALWLEPYLRYTQIFDVQWLLRNALQKDIYLLLPPDNVVICPTMMRDLFMLLENLGTKFI